MADITQNYGEALSARQIRSQRWNEFRETPAWKNYHGHVFGCPGCNPARARYCETGFQYWVDYQVPLRVEGIMAEKSVRRRRALLDSCPDPLRDYVAAGVEAAWKARQQERENCR